VALSQARISTQPLWGFPQVILIIPSHVPNSLYLYLQLTGVTYYDTVSDIFLVLTYFYLYGLMDLRVNLGILSTGGGRYLWSKDMYEISLPVKWTKLSCLSSKSWLLTHRASTANNFPFMYSHSKRCCQASLLISTKYFQNSLQHREQHIFPNRIMKQ